MTILEESCHTLLILEHDPLLYEDAREMTEYVALAMKDASKSSIVLLYSAAFDPSLEEMINYADRVFYFAEGPRATATHSTKNSRKMQTGSAGQTTLGTF